MATILFAIVIVLSLAAYRLGDGGPGDEPDRRSARAHGSPMRSRSRSASLFLYPYWWMVLGAFRSHRGDDVRRRCAPGRRRSTWPCSTEIARIGGAPLWRYAMNSVAHHHRCRRLGVVVTALGAYAIVRRPDAGSSRGCATGSW